MVDKREIDALLDATKYQGNLCLDGFEKKTLLFFLREMLRIRMVEFKLAEGRRLGKIGGPIHLGAGQEAIAVGVSSTLRKSDRVFGGHRSHAHVLSMGATEYKLFAEVLCKDTGLSRGMGGSMHLYDKENGFYGAVPIVAGTVPLAVGAGLAARFQKSGDVGVAYLGDGAVEEGVVHESFNLAKVLNVPVLFVIENNQFASHMHISQRQPENFVYRFAEANSIPYSVVDGNDVLEVCRKAKELVGQSRSLGCPVFIEALTYRWFGHVDWRDDIDVGVNRSQEELLLWKKRDPIQRLLASLKCSEWITGDEYEAMKKELNANIEGAWDLAMADPFPDECSILDRVYAG